MARPKNSSTVELGKAVDLTAGMIERMGCPAGKSQVFLRDAKSPGLAVRMTSAGTKSFVFESKLDRKTIRRTIGSVKSWAIDQARIESNRLRVLLDSGTDPRDIDRQRVIDRAQAEKKNLVEALTVAEVWAIYLEERRPYWGERTYFDHVRASKAGGEVKGRGTRNKGVTIPGPLHSLMAMRLIDLKKEVVEAWAISHGKIRPTYGRLAWRLLKAFINWAGASSEYKGFVQPDAASSRRARDAFGKAHAKADVIQREQLEVWFRAVNEIDNPIISSALQLMVLLGARPGEVLDLRWEDIDFHWKTIIMRDKVEGKRTVPLTNYVSKLLSTLPRNNEWVFFSPTSKSGKLTSPRKQHVEACKKAGIEGLTLQGLRRSFGSLSDWIDSPVGVVAQVMGHKASAIAEKHYRVRSLELLRKHHQRIEDWMLENAKMSFTASNSRLSLVSS